MAEAPVQPIFSSESASDELPSDRPVRVSGFVALALGLLSACAIFSRVFLPLPVLTLILAGIALRPSSRGVPVGRSAAYAGAVLAIFFGSWGWVQETTKEKALQQDAAEFAAYWLASLQQGDAEVAIELASPPSIRQNERMSLEAYYQRNEEAREKLQDFVEQPLISMVLAGGESLRWELAEPPIVTRTRTGDEVRVRMRETSGMISGIARIDLMREVYALPDSTSREWFVIDFDYQGTDQ